LQLASATREGEPQDAQRAGRIAVHQVHQVRDRVVGGLGAAVLDQVREVAE